MSPSSTTTISPVALVTGASRGIGRGIAIELARIGYSVAINFFKNRKAAFESQRLCEQVAPSGSNASFGVFQADISKAKDRTRLLRDVRHRFAWINLLVNNAGVAPVRRKDLLQSTEESFSRVIDINLRGPYFLTQAVANFWIDGLKKESGRGPTPKIVNISSISAYAPSINRGEYCVSKAALSMMTQLFALRLARHHIHVYEIRPGIIMTDMTAPARREYNRMISGGQLPIARWGTPQDVGRAVAAIAQDCLPFATGEVVNVDGGFHLRRC